MIKSLFKKKFNTGIRFSSTLLILLFTVSLTFSQGIRPLKGGERILFVANSFTSFFGPLPVAINAIYKVADPSFKPINYVMTGKGCGIIKEYVVWSNKPSGTGSIDSIRHGNWDYVVVQAWEDAVNMKDTAKTFMGCGAQSGYPQNQDTLIKYFKILDNEIKAVNSKTIFYAPHVNTWNYTDQLAKIKECYTKLKSQVSVPLFIPTYLAWDSVKTDYPTTHFACKDAKSDGFIKLLYSDCDHQSGNGMALDAFTWYTILSGGLSGVGLIPVFPSAMGDPSSRDYLAEVGCKIGRKILLSIGSSSDFEAPSTPTGLSASDLTDSSVTLSWNPSTDNIGVTGYEVYVNGVFFANTTSTNISVKELGPGLNYNLTVKAYDAAGHYTVNSSPLNITTTGTIIITNGSFEIPVVTSNSYNPKGSFWTYSGTKAGITASPPSKCDGAQTGFLNKENTGIQQLSQTVNLTAGNYKCTFYTTVPSYNANFQSIRFVVGSTEYDVKMSTRTVWEKHIVKFPVATTGACDIKFYLPANTCAFIDNVVIETATAVIPATGVSVTPSALTISSQGGTSTLTATVVPANTTYNSVAWSSSDTNIATVSASGVVTAVGNGLATITAKTTDGNFTASSTVTVDFAVVKVTGISVLPSTVNVTAGLTTTLTTTIFPDNARNKNVNWSTGNAAIAKVDAAGVVTGVSPGNVTITATSADDNTITATSSVTVQASTVSVTGVNVTPSTLSLLVGGSTSTLAVVITPANASNTNVSWSSSDTNVATVSSSGVVTPVSNGVTLITANTIDGGKMASAEVTVTTQVVGVNVVPSSLSIIVDGATTWLAATITPATASNKNVSWSTNNSDVATVSSAGLVSPIGVGNAIITATTEDGLKTSTCSVEVSTMSGISQPKNQATCYSIYPNPTVTEFKVKGIDGSQKIKVFDLTGILIYETKSDKISTSTWTSGLYFVQISDKNNTTSLMLEVIK